MDPQHITRLLTVTFESDNARRDAAEKALKQFSNQHGFCLVLLKIVCNGAVHKDVRKSAALYLKNRTKARKSLGKGRARAVWSFLSDSERLAIKAAMIKATVRLEGAVQRIMEDAVANIAFHDYPASWPQLDVELLACIKSQKQATMEAALHTLVQITKQFEFRFTDSGSELRAPVKSLVQTFMPVLAVLFRHLVTQNSTAAARMMTSIVKMYV